MNLAQAQKIRRDYYRKTNPTGEDQFEFTEALRYLITTTTDSDYAAELGGYYYELKRFDLAKKYYEIAADGGHLGAILGLAYIYYYGRTGEPDYEKAFYYYKKAADFGDINGAYKLADMYRNGYYVEKDPARYRQIIEELYPRVQRCRSIFDPLPEVFTRLAKIRADEGETAEALRLYDRARVVLARRIQASPFFGNLTIMKWLVRDTCCLRPLDPQSITLYDLYELFTVPAKVHFRYEEEVHEAEALLEDDSLVFRLDDQWFRTIDDFFARAELDDELLTTLYEDLYGFEVIR